MEVVGSERTVALGALPLSGVVTHLQTFVAENVETLGEHRLLVSGVTTGATQLGLKTDKHTCEWAICELSHYLIFLSNITTTQGYNKQVSCP